MVHVIVDKSIPFHFAQFPRKGAAIYHNPHFPYGLAFMADETVLGEDNFSGAHIPKRGARLLLPEARKPPGFQ